MLIVLVGHRGLGAYLASASGDRSANVRTAGLSGGECECAPISPPAASSPARSA
jgi:hypothetical protein